MKQEAAAARAAEEARQREIDAGKADIDIAFGGFNDQFYDKNRSAYLDYYQPQVDTALKNEQEQLSFGLSRAGLARSSAAVDKTAKLNNAYDMKVAGLRSEADNSAAGLRGDVEGQRNALINQLYATGDRTQATNAALASSKMFAQQRPNYSPIGDIFAGVTGSIGSAAQGYKSGRYAYDFNNALGGYNPMSALSGNSGKVVG